MRHVSDTIRKNPLRAVAILSAVGAALALGSGCDDGTGSAVSDMTSEMTGVLGRNGASSTSADGTSCDEPNDGCPCTDTQEGLSTACGIPEHSKDNGLECYKGLRSCKDGRWGECISVGNPAFTPITTAATGLGIQALGNVEACAKNPCNPYCMNYNDTPVGVDAGTGFKNLPDGGLTTVAVSCAGLPTVDDDGDGWTEQQGDCNDCVATINPGAYDYPNNGIDENCDGTADNEVTSCDTGIALATQNATDFAKTIDLCKFTTAAATGANKTWGVISNTPDLVRADADPSKSPGTQQYGVMPYFGNAAANGAKKGSNLAVFSSGKARYPGQSGYTKAKGWCGGDDENTTSATPCGTSWNKAGCAAGTGGNDSSGMLVQVRVPTNAQCMSFRFNYLSSEYPEWVCTAYNDAFVAMLTSSAMTPGSGCCGTAPNVKCNISYGANFTPVSVNNNLFAVPGCTTCSNSQLAGTGFDTNCPSGQGSSYIGGGATGWLYSFAPVKPGETITFHTSVWDTGDHSWDSTVLIDAFEFYPGTCSIGTSPSPPATVTTTPTQYASGTFSRDFEATCRAGFRPVWRQFKWTSMEPGDSSIAFKVSTAATLAGLGAATQSALVTSKLHTVPTTSTADVLNTIAAPAQQRFLRVTMSFFPSSNGSSSPTLYDWNQAYDCLPNE